MVADISRRSFISALGAGAAALAMDSLPAPAAPVPATKKLVTGSWFEFQHHATVEGVDWNPACARFSAAQWEAKIKEMAEIGMKYLVLMATALYYRAFYKTQIFPKWELECPDPIETVLSAADKYAVRVFMGGGFYGDWQSSQTISDAAATRRRLHSMEELARLYGHHRSFYGWYWPDEARINPRYTPEFIRYVNTNSNLARQLTPRARILIAPYGTRVAIPDEEYVRQLDALDVDIVAYQDEVGVRKSTVAETSAFYENLKKAHDRTKQARIWADVEVFEFEGEVYKSALMPASFNRVQRQLEAVSPWVDEILIYQYLGLMNQPGSAAFAGSQASTRLYSDYLKWSGSV